MRYDITRKTLFYQAPLRLLHVLTGSISAALVSIEYPSAQRRRADLVARLQDGRLDHLELQSDADRCMPWRMLEYYGLLYQQYNQEPVQQVLYVRGGRSGLVTTIAHQRLQFAYDVVDIRDVEPQLLLESPVLEDKLLALLCAGGTTVATIRHILAHIALLGQRERSDALERLLILAALRGGGATYRRGDAAHDASN
jgi:hypothetical protein